MPGRKFFIPLVLLALWFGGRAWYFSGNAELDRPAPDFTAVRMDGAEFSLSELRGRPVLLDFWGSWCGPCRRESPELARLSERGLTIVSVAIERDSAAWQRALAQDGRDWPYQVMDRTGSLKFLSGEVADLYGINAVPSNVLIDAEGNVSGVNLPLPEIAAAL